MKTVTVDSANKDDAYISTLLMFSQVQQMSRANIGN